MPTHGSGCVTSCPRGLPGGDGLCLPCEWGLFRAGQGGSCWHRRGMGLWASVGWAEWDTHSCGRQALLPVTWDLDGAAVGACQ